MRSHKLGWPWHPKQTWCTHVALWRSLYSGPLYGLPPNLPPAAQIAAYLQYMAASHTRLQTARIDNTHFLQAGWAVVGCAPVSCACCAAVSRYAAASCTSPDIVDCNALQIVGEGFTPLKSWCRGHPDAATHANIAQQLIQFINAVFPGWAGAAA